MQLRQLAIQALKKQYFSLETFVEKSVRERQKALHYHVSTSPESLMERADTCCYIVK